jgi:flavin-dependent dehydrogenase
MGMTESMRKDVAILGGGLAGLTLSLQLRQRFPDLDIVVLERRRHPVPEATHKVGESTVEIAAHYFDTVLGLKEHLVRRQLKKFGFRFFFSEGRRDIDAVLEVGASTYFTTPGYQIDRGIFENFLAQHTGTRRRVRRRRHRARGGPRGRTRRRTACAVRREGVPLEIEARWVVDASGRAGILKRQLGLGSTTTTT